MAKKLPGIRQANFQRTPLLRLASATLLAVSLWAGGVWAKDPFRTTNTRPIGDRTEAAFKAMFEQGNYTAAAQQLNQAEASEPLAHAMKASLGFIQLSGNKAQKDSLLEQIRQGASQTRSTAQQLLVSDPLRGNLYLAVSEFLDGAYILSKEGTVKGIPQALGKLQSINDYLKKAEDQGPEDPELNLIKGYMDLLTGLNLPLADPQKALDRLAQFAGPRYLADRGLALGYRELDQLDKAMSAVDRALQQTPDNPDVLYLKAQLLTKQKNDRDAVTYLNRALAKKDQLPASTVKQIERDLRRAQKRLTAVR